MFLCHACVLMNDLGFELGLGPMFHVIVLLYFCLKCESFFGVVLLLFPVLEIGEWVGRGR